MIKQFYPFSVWELISGAETAAVVIVVPLFIAAWIIGFVIKIGIYLWNKL